ncbi:MAG: sodium transporter [Leptolyngbyaceae cyanobacterium MO_188.B28]|nr:sodium transporter [Leptolyngbyaceae cyanobacterium MO_188.B28]
MFRQSRPSKSGPRLYNTFEGVFKPTLLTILGVIMYLRVGWVVGNAGLMGGLMIVLGAVSITLATGLSVSSIATNTQLKAGGPYAMISKSLGVEIGGSVGVPLFLSQALAVAMYLFGFREGWMALFPNHSALLVDLSVFMAVFIIAYISAGLAFQIQYLVMVLIGISLISIFGDSLTWDVIQPIQWWGTYPGSVETGLVGTTPWVVFAVFFPATTGILAGVNMSGELKNSRQSIPMGTLSAIGVSTLVYVVLCIWASQAATPDELVGNYTIMVEKSLWGPSVLAGLMAATFSAALSSLVGASRILMALGRDGVLPNGEWLARLSTKNGEPRRALGLSGAIAVGALLMRDLNAIAPLITMFFLITYATINLAVLIESSLGLMNFRPTLKLTRLIPLYGFVGCLVAILVINPIFSVVALVIVVCINLHLVSQPRERRPPDVRSGVLVAVAQWAATKVVELDMTSYRAWKPTMLVPVEDKSQLLGEFRLLIDLCKPEGGIKLVGLASNATVEDLSLRIDDLSSALRRRGVFTTWSVLEVNVSAAGILAAMQTMQGTFFRPNVLFLRLSENSESWRQTIPVFEEARRLNVGVLLLGLHPVAGMGRAEVINLWIRPQLDELPIPERLQKGSVNLALLMALRLYKAWKGVLNLVTVVPSEDEIPVAQKYVNELRELCRIPRATRTIVLVGKFEECVYEAPQSDMDFMGIQATPDFEFVHRIVTTTGSSCIFVRDSGAESAMA